MLVGIISDTHDHLKMVEKAFNLFVEKNVEYIIHLGDIISPFVVKKMKAIIGDKNIKVIATKGNNDGDIYLLKKLFDEVGWIFYSTPSMISIDGLKIFIMHGYNGIEFTEKMAESIARSIGADIVLFGHTHRTVLKNINNTILFNPGEACGYLTGKSTIGILDTKTRKIELITLN